MRCVSVSLILAILVVVVASKLRVDPKTRNLIDEDGNYVVLHGVNVAYKSPPYLPPEIDVHNFFTSFSDEDAKQLKAWGMNFVRLTFYWEGVENVRGVYDMEYINKMKAIAKLCKKYGIYVLLDLHQDVANKKFCGEGMPDWAVKDYDGIFTKFPAPLYYIPIERGPDGYPTYKSCMKSVFAMYYNSYAVGDTFRRLYTNDDKIGDSFRNMWRTVVKHLKTEDNVIGYEIINEPWLGNAYKDPMISYQDKLMLPFYQAYHKVIREEDPDRLILFDLPISDFLIKSFYGTPGGKSYNEKQMLSYHVYAVPEGDPKDLSKDRMTASMLYGKLMNHMAEEEIGGILTEFGAISGQTKEGLLNMRHILDIAEKYKQSWAYWQYKFYNDHTTAARPPEWEGFYDDKGNIIKDKLYELCRPYVTKSPLNIEFNRYDFKENTFEAEFTKEKVNKSNPIELYLNEEYHFTQGVDCDLSECKGCVLNRLKGESKHWFQLEHSKAAEGKLRIKCAMKK